MTWLAATLGRKRALSTLGRHDTGAEVRVVARVPSR
jgi:hypothetical protein